MKKHLMLMYFDKDIKKNKWFIDTFIEKCTNSGIYAELVSVEKFERGDYEKIPDIVVARMIYPELSLKMEKMGIRVFNNSKISYLCNNKAKTYEAVHDLNICHIPTITVSRNNKYIFLDSMHDTEYFGKIHNLSEKDITYIIERKSCIKNDIYELSDSFVIKSVSGHGGKEVMLLKQYINDESISLGIQESVASLGYNETCVIQPLIRSERDLRIYVIGKEIIGAVKREANGDFRANYSLNGNVSFYNLNEEQKRTVNKLTSAFNTDYAGFDFLLYGEDDKLIFNEIEDVVGARMLTACSDVDYIGKYIKHISETFLLEK